MPTPIYLTTLTKVLSACRIERYKGERQELMVEILQSRERGSRRAVRRADRGQPAAYSARTIRQTGRADAHLPPAILPPSRAPGKSRRHRQSSCLCASRAARPRRSPRSGPAHSWPRRRSHAAPDQVGGQATTAIGASPDRSEDGAAIARGNASGKRAP